VTLTVDEFTPAGHDPDMNDYRWLIYAALGALAAGAIAPLGRRGVEDLNPHVVTAVRSVFQALVVIAVVTALGAWGELRRFDARAYGAAALAGVVGALSWLFMFKALSLAPPNQAVARVTPIDRMSLVVGVLLAVIFLRERPTTTNWLGIALMTIGAVLAGWKG
jgi:transporter family protein